MVITIADVWSTYYKYMPGINYFIEIVKPHHYLMRQLILLSGNIITGESHRSHRTGGGGAGILHTLLTRDKINKL